MSFRLFLFIFAGLAALSNHPVMAFTGSDSCATCHAQEHEAWQDSHHDLAMQLPTADTVLGDFDNATFTYNGITSTFFQRDAEFIVKTDGEDGTLTEFPVSYVFGVYPLQQYLLPLSGGRLQALSITWDARPAEEGGQRWYHLYPEEPIDHKDPLHWTGPYQNWNTRCAECHSTDVRKQYDAKSRSFNTTFEEIDVGCEACHGPGETHINEAVSGTLDESSESLFPTRLSQRGDWAFPEGETIARRSQPLQSRAQIDNCGRCHARRATLGDYHYGADLLDTHRVSLPLSPLYHHDGQIRDEVYVYGSFMQSKMQAAGVVCSNCHEPHSLALRAPGNGVCAQCHNASEYDRKEHHRHQPNSTGSLCADCHMPETTYMGVDPRRDHSIRIPRPDLSLVIGTPNACNQCHTDKSNDWSLQAMREWGVEFRDTGSHPARAFAQAASGDTRSVPALASIANDSNAAPLWRAAAMETLGQFGGRDALQTATTILYDDDPYLRLGTIRGLQFLPLHQQYQLLQPLMNDEITAIRLEVAVALAPVPLDQVSEEQAEALRVLFKEYTDIQNLHADMPGVQMQLGVFYAQRGDSPSAERAYREALMLNKQLIPAYLNLADLLRSAQREDEARELLLTALQISIDNGPVLHSLGLLVTRLGETDKALDYLGRAAELEQEGTRHRYVFAIAQHDLGKPRDAVATLEALLREVPRNEDVLLALTNYYGELGEKDKALMHARSLTRLAPGNAQYQQLLQQIQGL